MSNLLHQIEAARVRAAEQAVVASLPAELLDNGDQAEPYDSRGPTTLEGWRSAALAGEKERDWLRERLRTVDRHQGKDCWYWQNDGEDHLESLTSALPVVIRADHLRALLAERQQALDMLAGLHPCLTTDDPAEMARQIFDAVMAERAAHAEELANHRRNLEGRDALISRWRAGMRELIPQRMGAEAIRERLQSLLAGAASHP